jgi:hypothetical protein
VPLPTAGSSVPRWFISVISPAAKDSRHTGAVKLLLEPAR